MNILKTTKRKIISGIMSGLLLLSAVPFTGIAAMAAEMPQETMTVTTEQTQVYYDGGLVSGGNSFVMADGSIAICANHDIPAPTTGSLCTLSRTLGQSYIDGNLGETSTTWAFLCFYYSEKLAASGAIATSESNRSYATSLAVRKFFQQHTAGTDDPYTALMLDWTTQITNAAQADADGIAAQLQWIDGTAIYDRHDGTAARLALYAPNSNNAQPLLVYSSNIPYVTTGYATLVKTSANPTLTDGNDCYSLAGAVYGIYTDWDCTNQVGTFTTDEWGNSNTVELNAGTYYIKEITAPMGFALDYNTYEVVVTNGQTSTVYVTDNPQNDPIGLLLQKQDTELGQGLPQGSASLANTEFTVKYFAEYYDTNPQKQGIQPTRQWVLRTDSDGFIYLAEEYKVSGDNFYYRTNGDVTLPLGTVTLQETKAPEGYLINPEIFVRQITSDGNAETIFTYNAPVIPESVIRGDLELIKIEDETNHRMANIPFQITSKTTGESHVIVTDENGYASTHSSWNSHLQNTNAGQTSSDGVWFGTSQPDDTKGALLYDTYMIDELPCANNEGKQLLTGIEITISRDNYTVNLGTLTNDNIPKEGIVQTTAKDQATDSNQGQVADTVTIVDTVQYENLKVGVEYTLKGILMDKATNAPLLINGEQVTAQTVFTPTESNGTVDVIFTFDGSTLAGKEVVVFETLYRNGVEVAVHTDINDKGQTVTFPSEERIVQTTAKDQATDSNQGQVADTVTIVDTVQYENLKVGVEYTLQGILMDKATNAPLLINGEQVTAQTVFTPTEPNGTVDVTFTFDGSQLWGKEVVVFETLYRDGIEVGVHADINDEGQTVTYPEQPEIPVGPEQPEIPKTGDNRWFIPVLTSSLLVSAVLLAGFIFHKKKHGENGHS